MNLVKLRKLVQQKNIIWHKHALEKMLEREIYRDEVVEVLLKGEEIENYENANLMQVH